MLSYSILSLWLSLFFAFIVTISYGSMIPRSIISQNSHNNIYLIAKKSNVIQPQQRYKNNKSFETSTPFERFPDAVARTISVSFKSLFSNSFIMVPLCLAVGAFRGHKTAGIWLEKSVIAGLEWGVISSVYAGAEEFLKVLRDRNDVFNRSLASGLASGFFQYRSEGIKGFGMGFLSGFAFVYVFDQLVPLPASSDETLSRKVVRGGK